MTKISNSARKRNQTREKIALCEIKQIEYTRNLTLLKSLKADDPYPQVKVALSLDGLREALVALKKTGGAYAIPLAVIYGKLHFLNKQGRSEELTAIVEELSCLQSFLQQAKAVELLFSRTVEKLAQLPIKGEETEGFRELAEDLHKLYTDLLFKNATL